GALADGAEHGKAYYPNQSLNGLLNGLMSVTEPRLYANLEFLPERFPPFNPWVYGGTMVAAAVILLAALVLPRWREHEGKGRDSTIDFCIMAAGATLASPNPRGGPFRTLPTGFFAPPLRAPAPTR